MLLYKAAWWCKTKGKIFFFQEQTKNAQFIIISLRNNMFEIADRLIGIYKTNNTTKSVGINPKTIVFKEHDAITA